MIRISETVRGVKAGQVYGDRQVVGPCFSLGSYQTSILWAVVVRCKCGNHAVVRLSNLKFGAAGRCTSCSSREAATTHGKSDTPLYIVWAGMKKRCSNKNSDNYYRYGGRGIRVCDEWSSSFEAFEKWAIENGYAKGMEIDRQDNNGNYEPSNCRWTTHTVNNRNRDITRLFDGFGESKTISEWLNDPRCVVGRYCLTTRLYANWNVELAITKMPRKSRKQYA